MKIKKCPYQSVGEVDKEVIWLAVAQLSDEAIRRMASEQPGLFYKWFVEAYTAKKKAELEFEFQSALLEKLQNCNPQAKSNSEVLTVA